MGPNMRSFGHHGLGGSIGFGDPDAKLGFSYCCNQMHAVGDNGPRARRLIDAVYSRRSETGMDDGQGTLRQGHENPPRGAGRCLCRQGDGQSQPVQRSAAGTGRDLLLGLDLGPRGGTAAARSQPDQPRDDRRARAQARTEGPHARRAEQRPHASEEIREVLLQVGIYAGIPAAVDSFRIVNEAFAEIDAEEAES